MEEPKRLVCIIKNSVQNKDTFNVSLLLLNNGMPPLNFRKSTDFLLLVSTSLITTTHMVLNLFKGLLYKKKSCIYSISFIFTSILEKPGFPGLGTKITQRNCPGLYS